MSARILGIDLSLNHAGLTLLDERGRVTWHTVVTDSKGVAARAPVQLFWPGSLSSDPEQADLDRLLWWERTLRVVIESLRPTHVGLEGYAFLAKGNSHYQIGELGGVARLAALRSGACLRLHDPMSVKLFGAGSGSATGADVADAVAREVGPIFAACNPPAKAGKKLNRLAEEDLAAAYVVARMVWTEIEVRAGRLPLEALADKQRQVFLRVTKSQPINVLAREWLVGPPVPVQAPVATPDRSAA